MNSPDYITDPSQLLEQLELQDSALKSRFLAQSGYPLLVPCSFVNRMKKGDPNDPLLLQVLPLIEETQVVPGFSSDPLGERELCVHGSEPACGRILQKYQGRALILASGCCAIHCRFCFRRHTFPADIETAQPAIKPDWGAMLAPFRERPDIQEIILSGGDPLCLNDEEFHRLIHYIEKIPDVKRIRIHSRIPVAHPDRISDSMIRRLLSLKGLYLVIHINHANELDGSVLQMLDRLKGISILSQTVLLKGINDDIEPLSDLFERLINHRVLPYYLHQLDRVQGAAHFEVPVEKGLQLIQQLTLRLPGYAVPRYVREIAGQGAKQRLE